MNGSQFAEHHSHSFSLSTQCGGFADQSEAQFRREYLRDVKAGVRRVMSCWGTPFLAPQAGTWRITFPPSMLLDRNEAVAFVPFLARPLFVSDHCPDIQSERID